MPITTATITLVLTGMLTYGTELRIEDGADLFNLAGDTGMIIDLAAGKVNVEPYELMEVSEQKPITEVNTLFADFASKLTREAKSLDGDIADIIRRRFDDLI